MSIVQSNEVRFTRDEAQAAGEAWGFNCGPGALCAVLGKTPNELRPHLREFERKRYTNPSLMAAILHDLHVPFRRDTMQWELACYKRWFEEHRPHQSLDGRTPQEVCDGIEAEPPPVDVARSLELVVHFHEGRRELPIVELKNAA